MQSVVALLADGIEGEVYFLQTGQTTQFSCTVLQSLNLVESQREHSDVGRKKVDGYELIVVQKELFKTLVVRVVEEREIFDVVVHQGQLSQCFDVAEVE